MVTQKRKYNVSYQKSPGENIVRLKFIFIHRSNISYLLMCYLVSGNIGLFFIEKIYYIKSPKKSHFQSLSICLLTLVNIVFSYLRLTFSLVINGLFSCGKSVRFVFTLSFGLLLSEIGEIAFRVLFALW